MNIDQALEAMRAECIIQTKEGKYITVGDAQRLKYNTAPIRIILGANTYPFSVLDSIKNLLEYYKWFEKDMLNGNTGFLFAILYQLGYIEGKRAERAKRKKREQQTAHRKAREESV